MCSFAGSLHCCRGFPSFKDPSAAREVLQKTCILKWRLSKLIDADGQNPMDNN